MAKSKRSATDAAKMDAFSVTQYHVARGIPVPHPDIEGALVHGALLSGAFESEGQAREALAFFQGEFPDAVVQRRVSFFNPGRPEDVAERAEMLARMRRLS